jgi:hypothetical protein
MEMKVVINAFGFSIPKTGLGINAFAGSYIMFRNSEKAPIILMGLTGSFSLGEKSGTVIIGYVETNWFFIDPEKHNWIMNTNALIGKKAEIEVIGTLLAKGRVDFKFFLYEKDGDTKEMLSKVDIKSSGVQLANTKVRGVLRQIN